MKRSELKQIIKEELVRMLREEEQTPTTPPAPEQAPKPEEKPTPEPKEEPKPVAPSIKTISKAEAKYLIRSTRGKFFTVTFIKKDGSERVMNARLGVKAYLKGGELPYHPDDYNLIPVFDVQIKQYRMISVDTLKNIKIGNLEYNVA